MGWTSPRTWVSGEVVTASSLNIHVRDNLSYLHTSGAMRREGGSTAEASSTSMSQVDMVTVGGLSIPPERPMIIMVTFGKTTVAGSLKAVGIGLKANGTVVATANTSNYSNEGYGALSNLTTSETGITQVWIGPRDNASYRRHSIGEMMAVASNGVGNTRVALFTAMTSAWPGNTVTAIAITGRCETNSATVYVTQVHIYSIPATSI